MKVLCEIGAAVWASPLASIGGDLGRRDGVRKEGALDIGCGRWVWTADSRVDSWCTFKENVERTAAVGIAAIVGTGLGIVGVEHVVSHEAIRLSDCFEPSCEGNEISGRIGS